MAGRKAETYEQRLSRVEKTVQDLESGKLPMEEAMARYQEARELLTRMNAELKDMQQKLTVLRRDADGTDEEVPLEGEA